MSAIATITPPSERQLKNHVSLRQTLANRRKTEPNSWRPFQTMSQLGAALAGQGKYADAEPMLIDGFEGLVAREKDGPARLRKEAIAAAKRLGHALRRYSLP